MALLLSGCTPQASGPDGDQQMQDTPTPMSDEALVRQYIDDAWSQTGLSAEQRPDVEIVRFVSIHEWESTMAACMDEGGWSTYEDDGTFTGFRMPEGQESAYQLDWFRCQASYPADPKYLRPFDETQRDRLYTYYDTALRACFEEHGQTMAELPSRGKFVEDYYRMTWDAYADVTGTDTPQGARDFDRLQRECSMIAPADSDVWE
ncbi:hypothetical protein [Agromyces marinus]|uniref:hypothetical protein n=1 Tax=Agromyces marinus TaxID=1389020 RepID=UPI0025741A7C|nr:hypothetical protein [Agromyces marinus]